MVKLHVFFLFFDFNFGHLVEVVVVGSSHIMRLNIVEHTLELVHCFSFFNEQIVKVYVENPSAFCSFVW